MPKKHKKNHTSAERELEDAFRKITGSKNDSKSNTYHSKSIVAVICIALAVIFLCSGALLFYLVQQDLNRVIIGDVTIAGIRLQGMTQAEAFQAIEEVFHPKALTVTIQDHSVQIPSNCIEGLNTRNAVRAAYKLGNTTDTYTLDLKQYLKVDEDQIRSQLAEFKMHFNTTLQQSSYQILGQAPNQVLQITVGMPEYGLDLEQLYQETLAAIGDGLSELQGQCSLMKPDPIDLTEIQTNYCRPAIDATYDLNTHKITGGEDGYGFDINTVSDTLGTADFGVTLEFPFAAIPPSVTREELTESLFKDTLGTFTAKSSSQSNRDTNLRLACEAINGLTLFPGDTFSYNDTLGERTPEKGYRPAGTYVGNETVNTYGGGICQVSSSLYYCVLLAELTIIERTNHGFLPSYMPRGLDATVNWGTLDFRFKNTLDYPIRIVATAKGGTTTISLLGTETRNYRVELGAKIISKTAYKTEYRVLEANNKDGYKDGDSIVSPHTGYYVKSYIYRYEKDSDKLISKEYIDDSTYRVRNAVICKIETSSGSESIPEPTIPDNTNPPSTPDVTPPAETPPAETP